MTLDQFFEQLAATKETHQWHVRESGDIRGRRPDRTPCCPITAVAVFPYAPISFFSAARDLGLCEEHARYIANSADANHPSQQPLRARLLSTLGLS